MDLVLRLCSLTYDPALLRLGPQLFFPAMMSWILELGALQGATTTIPAASSRRHCGPNGIQLSFHTNMLLSTSPLVASMQP